MPDLFNFNIDETWEENLARLKTHLESQDEQCAKLLFENLATLIVEDGIAGRRDFNQIILTALDALADAEITESAT